MADFSPVVRKDKVSGMAMTLGDNRQKLPFKAGCLMGLEPP